MQISPLAAEGLSRRFSITVPAADMERYIEEELASLSHKVKIPGFRPGKIPMSVLRQRYTKDVMGEVVHNTVNKSVRALVEQEKLRPAMQPDVKITSFEEGSDLVLEVAVEPLPDMPKLDLAAITIDTQVADVTEEAISDALKRLASASKHYHRAAEGKEAAMGDRVKIDFLGKRDGVAFSGGAAKNFQLELGAGQLIPGFEEQIVGMKEGQERTIHVTFPAEYHSAELAGQKADFEITLHEVHEAHMPEVDEHLAEVVGFESLEKLTEAVRSRIADEYASVSRAKAKKALFDVLDEKLNVELPARMVAAESESILAQVLEAKKQGDPELKDKSEEALKAEYEIIARRRVKLGIYLSDIGREQNIAVTKEELSAAVMGQARQYPGQEERVFEFYRKNPDQVSELRGPILEEKAVDYLLSQVKKTETKVSAEVLMDEDDTKDAPAPKKNAKK